MKSLFGIAVFGVIALAGCKQGKGDRCQVQADCQSPYVCNVATHTCQETTGGGIDASIPDAPPGTKFDAAVDAPKADAPKADAMHD